MSLIKSVSGIRGTIGGVPGENLTPPDIVSFVTAYALQLKKEHKQPIVVIGRDARVSGEWIKNLVIHTLRAMGIHVIDVDYSTTPTVEMQVITTGASGGIIITASHNPAQWNALKFLNHLGEFISQETGEEMIKWVETNQPPANYATIDEIGNLNIASDAIDSHILAILSHPLVKAKKVAAAGLTAVVDCINSTGSISIPPLLDALGVNYVLLNDDMSGKFAHNPEPLPEHLSSLCQAVIRHNANLGISVDPDVDRLALVDENGVFFGEEYTLVCAADYTLQQQKGPVVTNLSSSLALEDLCTKYGVQCFYAPVGEVHVVKEMKARNAVLGGEGNGGVIDPALHYGRDALLGIALILMHLATGKQTLSELKSGYPEYHMVKDKISFDPSLSPQQLIDKVSEHYKGCAQDTRDGLKIQFDKAWVQLRKSNTEPILRVYAEARTFDQAKSLVTEVKSML